MKHITRLTTAMLSGLLLLLGFGSCRSAKRAAARAAEEAEEAERLRQAEQSDSIAKARWEEDNRKPTDPGRIRILYGPPPTRYLKDLDK